MKKSIVKYSNIYSYLFEKYAFLSGFVFGFLPTLIYYLINDVSSFVWSLFDGVMVGFLLLIHKSLHKKNKIISSIYLAIITLIYIFYLILLWSLNGGLMGGFP